jgi:hypothetical protein
MEMRYWIAGMKAPAGMNNQPDEEATLRDPLQGGLLDS